jgi:hypothetical protein
MGVLLLNTGYYIALFMQRSIEYGMAISQHLSASTSSHDNFQVADNASRTLSMSGSAGGSN